MNHRVRPFHCGSHSAIRSRAQQQIKFEDGHAHAVDSGQLTLQRRDASPANSLPAPRQRGECGVNADWKFTTIS